jgi:acyl transferase domain-containing protein/acyl carrier protein
MSSNALSTQPSREPIAIIGIGCRFPGEVNDPAAFWRLLSTGRDAITEIPADRWNIDAFYHPVPGTPGKTYARRGGFIQGIDQFEPECFGISPREAAYMDPQQRLLLEVAWEALEDGGQVPERLVSTNTGVFIGISTSEYAHIQSTPYATHAVDAHAATGGATSIAANRLSYCLGFQGPSLAVDTACSSSLVATHLACRSLWEHESDLALAGGVNVIITPGHFLAFCAASMLSPDGRCKAFDASANGFVRSEGAGIVVLKPLAKALADGDPVYALIVGSAVNQDGRTAGISAPSQSAQEALLRVACQQAGLAPRSIQYIEAHGTGTAVGDPIEARALGTVLSSDRPTGQSCLIGSVKTNIGHLEAAAGIAGVIKVALALQYRMIPPNLHFLNPNPHIPFEALQLRVPCTLEPWPDGREPAIAGVNAFGFGGTNAHLVMMEHQRGVAGGAALAKDEALPALLLSLSARTPEALQMLVRSYQDFLDRDSEPSNTSLSDLCYTASVRRTHFDHRVSLVVHHRDELIQHLEAFLAGERRPGMYTGRRVHGQAPKLVFVCSGQGPQWWGMGRELLEHEPVFRRTIEACDTLLQQHGDWSLVAELTADEASSRLQETALAQPAIFALQIALAALWKSWGVEPAAVVGHSVGEVAAAYIAGALRLEDAVRVIFHRGRCMDLASSKGRMLAVGLAMEEAQHAIQGYEDYVSLAASNGPSSTTLSGDPKALAQISQALERQGIFCRFLRVTYAFHSPHMDPVQAALLETLDGLEHHAPVLPMVSTVTGEPVEDRLFDAHYWWQNVRQSVRFAQAMDKLITQDYHAFVELSPHPVLAGAVSECLRHRGRQGMVLPSLRRQEAERATMLASLGALYTLGYPLDWQKQWPRGGRCVPLPRYPWQRQSYWHESEDQRERRLGKHTHPLLGRQLRGAAPSWETTLDKRLLHYLEDHRVQGHAVLPAAAYVEIALAASRQHLGGDACVLEALQFQKPLFLPNSDAIPTVQLIVYPADTSFGIYSRTIPSDPSWVLYMQGDMRTQQEVRPPQRFDFQTLRHNLPDEMAPEDCYGKFAAVGLHFGPSFQGIERLWRTDGEALGQVQLRAQLELESRHYCFHPAFLDACFQVLFGTIPKDDTTFNERLYLPVHIERVRLHRHPSRQVWSHAHLTTISAKALEGDIRIYDNAGDLILEIDGFRCQAVGRGRDQAVDDMQCWFYETTWNHKPRPEQPLVHRAATYIPGTREIAQSMAHDFHQLDAALGWSAMVAGVEKPFDILSTAYLVQALHHLGWQCQVGDRLTVASLMEQLHLAPQYQRLMQRFMGWLKNAGYLVSVGTHVWEVSHAPPEQHPPTIWRHTLSQYPAFVAEMSLIARCGSHLAAVLRGDLDPSDLLFPEGSTALVEHLYQDSPSFRLYNTMVQKAVSHVLRRLPADRTVRLLEVGAGTGGLTTYVLPKLPERNTEYIFSDISPHFLARAERKFRDYSFMQFQILDIDQDPLQQGYESHTFDLILASDVLHATGNLREALGHILKLLSSEGLLVLLETEKAHCWLDLVFGLTAGWWRFRDAELRPDYPLITRHAWEEVLEQVGFTDVMGLSTSPNGQESSQVVILARGPQSQEAAQRLEPARASQPSYGEHGRWMIFADQSGVASKLAERLTQQGEACLLVTPGDSFRRIDVDHVQISLHHPADMERLLQTVTASPHPAWRGAIHLWSLDTPASEDPSSDSLQRAEVLDCHCVMHFIQALHHLASPPPAPQLILVTRGAQPIGLAGAPVSISHSPLVGLGRTLLTEHPEMRCKMIDLGLDETSDEISALLAELWTEDPEEEVALRHEARFVPRLERARPKKLAVEPALLADGETAPFRLVNPTSGVIDDLTLLQTQRQPPGPGHVEIAVCAAALNFRDVMKALGLYPTDGADAMLLGDECAGRIVAVGAGVHNIKVGDEVIAIAPASFGSYVTTLAALVMPKPTRMTFEEAVTLPIAFLTAYYALHHLAHIRAGERVLIHAATGGVGLAALQIARHAGAEVFATAGSPEKRELLHYLGVQHVMDSRSLVFADHIMEITGGQGVDIVLNALAGQAIQQGMACLAPYGRFLELGKRDIYQNSKIGLWALRKNAAFFAIDLGRLIADKPAFTESLLAELSQHFNETSFRPLPHRVFPVSRIVEAFRYLAQARHIGKIVISMQEHGVLIAPSNEETAAFRPDATYLITGGFGGFGATLARWIIEHGGRHLVLMGRSGAASEEAKRTLEDLQRTGARVVAATADVSKEQQVADVFADLDRTMPPLRGIFHTAMVLDDSILLHLDHERFRQVMAPKVDGTWNLHAQTLDRALDYFVLFSSVSSLVGSPGQGNYVAANTFLDAFASYRRSLGLPATTINWGHLADVGYVARHPELSEFLTRLGILGFSPKQAMAALGRTLPKQPIQIGVLRMDWQQWARSVSKIRVPQRLSSLMSEPTEHHRSDEASHIRQTILHAPPEERQEIVQTYVREQVARVLGTSAGKIDLERPLNELGLDSLMAIELKNRLESDLALSLPTSELMQSPSLSRLETVVIEQLATPVSTPSTPSLRRQETAEQLLAKVDQLSDEEVATLLHEMVGEEVHAPRHTEEESGG